jgi:uncharacterized membrane protein (DUF373 family)
MKSLQMRRLVAFLIDYVIICAIVVILNFIIGGKIMFNSSMTTEEFNLLRKIFNYLMILGLFLTIFKDIYIGRSIGL